MRNNKIFKWICNFYKFVYEFYIREDWNDYIKIGRVILYPFWLIRVIIVYLFSPLLIIDYINRTYSDWIEFKEFLIEILNKDLDKIKKILKNKS